MKKISSITVLLCTCTVLCIAQGKLNIENVRSASLRNSGTIQENREIKGYYAFYQSDKIDKHTNEYTLQLTDENLNKVKDIKFEDDKNVRLLESAYNGNSIMFLFYNSKEKTLEYRSYGFDGKEKMSYTKELGNRSKALLEQTYSMKGEEGENKGLFDIENKGYVTIYPVKDGKYYSYEVNYFFTDRKKQWTYEAAEEQDDKWNNAVYLGATDSLLMFEVIKQKTLLGGNPHSWLLGLNMFTGRKTFEISTEKEGDYKFYPENISTIAGSNNFLLMGTYYDGDGKIMKDQSLGLGMWTMDTKGKITAKKYNSWEKDFSKYLNTTQRGRVADVGYLFFHKIVQTDDGNFFAVGEGYKKVVNAGSTVLKGLSILTGGGGRSGSAAFKIKVTDLVTLQFNPAFEVTGAKIYDKFSNSVAMPEGAGYLSPHTMAIIVKGLGGFDYDYTKVSKEKNSFTVGYSDYEKIDEYKGGTFNSISYNDGKITTDKINLKSKASSVKVFPAKTGSVMIMEYYKKEKRLDFRMEKLN